MHGVIVTLYRQGRIDSAPALSSIRELSKEEAKRLEKDEYYPKSKTGLGGLSLSSAGSCSVFRKDLSQALTPLIIDPATLSASVTTSVRVPEDAFPTIKGVPGEMITFKYQVEVIVDLGGKLANQIQTNKAGSTRIGVAAGAMGPTGNPYEGGAASLASWSTSIIDTDRLRREKGVISVVFELVVGTMDSSRLRGKSSLKLNPSIRSRHMVGPEHRISSYDRPGWPTSAEDEEQDENGQQEDYDSFPQQPERYPYWSPPQSAQIAAPTYVPPPEVPDESGLSEKDRIRRAEQRLLPSQPPETPVAGPSRPVDPGSENIYDADDQLPAVTTSLATAPTPPILPAPPGPPPAEPPDLPPEAPSAPTMEDLTAGTELPSSEDKQELERRRLLAEASSPPEFPEDYDNGGAGSSSSAAAASAPPLATPAFEPSAPAHVEDEESYGPNFSYAAVASPVSPVGPGLGAEGTEPLPKYER